MVLANKPHFGTPPAGHTSGLTRQFTDLPSIEPAATQPLVGGFAAIQVRRGSSGTVGADRSSGRLRQ
jgi:hypothetical protein